MDIINGFINQFKREFDFFQKAASICARQCENVLQRNGIRAIVTFRAKDPERLRDKLIKRDDEFKKENDKNKYNSYDDIYNDIVDFAGVRIALYFPGDREEVSKIIRSNFDVEKEVKFPKDNESHAVSPYQKTFAGYLATHYRVKLKNDNNAKEFELYSQALIEIQVASVLMHAWSEVEHDLAYKPLTGVLSDSEYAILNELNGLVLVGESNLERLQKAIKDRVERSGQSFSNHYELASFIFDSLKQNIKEIKKDFYLGRADVLFRFLQLAKLNTPTIIKQYISKVNLTPNHKEIVEQIIDNLLIEKPELYNVYEEVYRDRLERDPYLLIEETQIDEKKNHGSTNSSYQEMLGYFMSKWVIFETIALLLKQEHDYSDYHFNTIRDINRILLDTECEINLENFERIRRLRNQVVHGLEYPSLSTLYNSVKSLEEIISALKTKLPIEQRGKLESQLVFKDNTDLVGTFINKALDALTADNDNGLFIKHHFKISENTSNGIDAMGEGPDGYKYLIKIMFTLSLHIIKQEANRLKKEFQDPKIRLIFVLPSFANFKMLDLPGVQIAYFDTVECKFENRTALYNWIYPTNS